MSGGDALAPFLAAHAGRAPIGELPGGTLPDGDAEAAYRMQRALVGRLGRTPTGWKVGCTNAWAQRMTGTDEPFYGRMFAETTHASPARLDSGNLFDPIVEPEIAFRLGADLVPEGAPYGPDEVAAAVAGLMPAIEIVDCRYAAGWPADLVRTIADNGVHACFVTGGEAPDWRAVDRPGVPVALEMNGGRAAGGSGANALGDPLDVLVWLANKCAAHGVALRAGEVVTTGNIADSAVHAKPGDTAVADFGALGRVEAAFA